jgi:hypothetical protein
MEMTGAGDRRRLVEVHVRREGDLREKKNGDKGEMWHDGGVVKQA